LYTRDREVLAPVARVERDAAVGVQRRRDACDVQLPDPGVVALTRLDGEELLRRLPGDDDRVLAEPGRAAVAVGEPGPAPAAGLLARERDRAAVAPDGDA